MISDRALAVEQLAPFAAAGLTQFDQTPHRAVRPARGLTFRGPTALEY